MASPHEGEANRLNFSFSGLKTAVARWVKQQEQAGNAVSIPDVAASFQEAVVDVLTQKAFNACKDTGIDHLVIGGGVAANSRLRALALERAASRGVSVRIPRPGLCTDNGAMIAALGSRLLMRGATPSDLSFSTTSVLPIETVVLNGLG